ncbi:hypothetical protein [Hymenobacter terrenus]|uniref:hypothetical protein n=1 Tax=Hymenobacter terrenus TaxID=1629124 RepID=UPI000B2D4B92|nr:hypothetical protein [Hymenobacter terrenus]
MARKQKLEFILESVTSHQTVEGVEELTLNTNEGGIAARLHPAPAGAPAVVWVGGAGAASMARPGACTRGWPGGWQRKALPRSGYTTASPTI